MEGGRNDFETAGRRCRFSFSARSCDDFRDCSFVPAKLIGSRPQKTRCAIHYSKKQDSGGEIEVK